MGTMGTVTLLVVGELVAVGVVAVLLDPLTIDHSAVDQVAVLLDVPLISGIWWCS